MLDRLAGAAFAVLVLVIAGGVAGDSGRGNASEADDDRVRSVLQAAIANPRDPARVEALLRELPEIPPGSGVYIVEGDIAVKRDEIVAYLESFTTNVQERTSGELIVNLGPGGEFDYWVEPASRKLTYAIDRGSFRSPAEADDVAARLAAAAGEWTGACPECNITFEEKSEPEAGPNFSQVVFVVRFLDIAGGPIARAFFPSSPPSEYELAIFPEYFSPTMSFDRTGVLRHELGHVLGYRHEHIGNVPGCRTEGSSWVRLTPYTPNSVMHYFCGGAGSFDLSLRDQDKEGHRCLYMTGKPCP